MSFFSTRGESCVTASQAILRGIAPDGGLYVPAMIPAVSPERLTKLTDMSYEERTVAVLKRFLEDFSLREIEDAVHAAYSPERFRDPAVAPAKKLDEATDKNGVYSDMSGYRMLMSPGVGTRYLPIRLGTQSAGYLIKIGE